MNRSSGWLPSLAFFAALSAGPLYAQTVQAGRQAEPRQCPTQGGAQDPATLLAHREQLGLSPEQVSRLEILQREQEALTEETLSVLSPAQRRQWAEGSAAIGAGECPMHGGQDAGQGTGKGMMHPPPTPR